MEEYGIPVIAKNQAPQPDINILMKNNCLLLVLGIVLLSCEEGRDNDDSYINPNEIIGEWEMHTQEYINLHWQDWDQADTIYINDFNENEYSLNINDDTNYNFEISWDYSDYNWYFFGSWDIDEFSDSLNITLLDWSFIEYPDTYLDEFYVLPDIIGYELKRATYPNPDTLCLFWEKTFIDNYYGIDYLTKK